MIFLLIFAFVSGLLTIAAPCIWPLLPIVLSASSTGGKRKPLGITTGILLSFTVLTLSLSYLVSIFHFDPNVLRLVAVVILFLLGLTMIVPKLAAVLESWAGKLLGRLTLATGDGFYNGLISGLVLGVVWSPCAGPILATIATLAATQEVTGKVILVTVSYMAGTGIPLFMFASLGSKVFSKSKMLSPYLGRIQKAFGIIIIATAAAIYTNYDKTIQAKLLDYFPVYQNFLFKLEGNSQVQKQLSTLRGKSTTQVETKSFLPDLGQAPDFVGITNWLNSPPLTLAELKGKVVLVDFWTYSCINCIRTLPFVTGWYEKYKDSGLVVVGVHTPEFQFEKSTDNVANALKMFSIKYPVAQDNDYATWNNFNNNYWPAKYLIDSNGHLRMVHFGEGSYEETERAIQSLLAEIGKSVTGKVLTLPDQTPTTSLTPETYLGLARMDLFSSLEKASGGVQKFTLPMNLAGDHFAYGGTWNLNAESGTTMTNSVLEINFFADHVYMVVTPGGDHDSAQVVLDGMPVNNDDAGVDVKNGIVNFNSPRLYELINLRGKLGKHLLRMEFNNPGVKVFTFTFG